MENNGLEAAEKFYKKLIKENQDPFELGSLYEELIAISLLLDGSEERINNLISEATSKTEKKDFKMEIITNLTPINEYFTLIFEYFLSGFPEDFSSIDQLDKKWIIRRYVKEARENTPEMDDNFYEELEKKVYGAASAKGSFTLLSEFEKLAQKNINPEIQMLYTDDYSRIFSYIFIPEKKGFLTPGKGVDYMEYTFLIDKAIRINNKVFVIGSEIVEGEYRNQPPEKGDVGTLRCDGEIVGSTVVKDRKKAEINEKNEYIYTISQSEMKKWVYVLEENTEGGYYVISKQKINE